mmetsp:Transcript_30973/g.67944  ORF Transcript_30973/g.67944 Transcript_30973/m.67944 type:complete len:299 (+) Transcript_30973:746-1642(+)
MLEGRVLGNALILHLLHLALSLGDVLDGFGLLGGSLLDEAIELIDLGHVLLDLPGHVLDGACQLGVELLALVPLGYVVLVLLLQGLDHRVDGLEHLIKVTHLGLVHLHSEVSQSQAVCNRRLCLQGRISSCHRLGRSLAFAVELQEVDLHAAVVGVVDACLLASLDCGPEELPSLIAGEDLDGLFDPLQLLCAEALPLVPLVGFCLAARLRLVEEGLCIVHLFLGVIVGGRVGGEQFLPLGLLPLLLGAELFHCRLLFFFYCNELLELALLGTLHRGRGLDVGAEGGVHVREDTLHRQ